MPSDKKLCFYEHERLGVECENTECRFWINCDKHKNCTLIAAEKGPMTLQDIGEIFDVTRMRICQLEKKIVGKLNQIAKRSNLSQDNML